MLINYAFRTEDFDFRNEFLTIGLYSPFINDYLEFKTIRNVSNYSQEQRLDENPFEQFSKKLTEKLIGNIYLEYKTNLLDNDDKGWTIALFTNLDSALRGINESKVKLLKM